MKQSKIIRAYKVLESLYNQKTSLAVSHKLWTLRKLLAPQWEFQEEKEKEVFMKYSPEALPDGKLKFKSEEESKACLDEYQKLITELSDLDVDLGEFNKIVLHADDKLDISMEDMDALSEFIDFVE